MTDPETASTPAHAASLRFSYDDERRARAVERAVAVEVGEIPRAGDAADPDGGMAERSRASVARDGRTVEVRVEAADLVALRAGTNTWARLVSVAEAVAGGATDGA